MVLVEQRQGTEMLIQQSSHIVETSTGPMTVFVITPKVAGYPNARFPGVVVWSEIYQVSGPVLRFANSIAAQGFVVACPTVYHEFEGDRALPYDNEGTDAGNRYKKEKLLSAYNSDSTATIDLLMSLPSCNGRIGATGMCLGGNLAFRCAFDPRIQATVCYFPTGSFGTLSHPSASVF